MTIKRWFPLASLLCASMVAGCVARNDVQALRADVAAIERDRVQRNQEIMKRLDRLDGPNTDARREMAETGAEMDELRVDVQNLRGMVQELQHYMENNAGPTAEARDIFATTLAELETRVAALEQHVDPQGNTALRLPREPSTPVSRPASAAPPAPKPVTPRPATRPPATRPSERAAQPPQTDDGSDRLYQRARQEYQAGNYEVAIVLFKQLLRQHPKAPLAGHAQYWLGESLYAQQQYEAAIVAFDEVVQRYADDVKVPAAILKQGYAFAALDDVRNARFFLEQVQRKYPESPEAKQAAKRLQELP